MAANDRKKGVLAMAHVPHRRLRRPIPAILLARRVLAILVASVFVLGVSSVARAESAAAEHWPSFRGPGARGVADGQNLPETWNGESGEGILWKTAIPGLAHSSPVVWGDRIYLTSAISSRPDATFVPGLYGDGTASDDLSPHRFTVYAVDAGSGKILWERTAHQGVPRSKRHIKATYANSTPATDGQVVIALFGSEGLYAYTPEGELLWSHDLGDLDLGAYNAPTYEWGYAASPILYERKVIVQVDTQGEDFLLALDAGTGKTLWRTAREELPSWGTPTVIPGPGGPELVTNASNFIRGYDPATGRELWRLGGSSQITAPTPFLADGLIILASGRRPESPLFAVRPGSRGDLTLPEGKSASDAVAWSWQGRGSYMPTPLAYGGVLYVISNQGVLDAYDLATGAEIYRQRLSHRGGGFSASPVAADGRIYIPSEDGDVFVVKAGRTYELLGTHPMGELLMATPALAGGTLYVRGKDHLFAVGKKAAPVAPEPVAPEPVAPGPAAERKQTKGGGEEG